MAVVASVPVETAAAVVGLVCLAGEVDIPVTVETPDPALAPALAAHLAPGAPALVTRLDHPGVGHRDQPHLLPEHPHRFLLQLPGQGGVARLVEARVQPRPAPGPLALRSVGSVAPASLSPLSEGLDLVVEGGHVLHLGDHHRLGRLPSITHVARHVVKETPTCSVLRNLDSHLRFSIARSVRVLLSDVSRLKV